MEPTTQYPQSSQYDYSTPTPSQGFSASPSYSQPQTSQGAVPPRPPPPPPAEGNVEGHKEDSQLQGVYKGTPPYSQQTDSQHSTPAPAPPAPTHHYHDHHHQEGSPDGYQEGGQQEGTAYAPLQAYVAAPPPVYEPLVATHGIPPPVAPGPGLPKNHPLNPNKDTKEAEHKAKIEAQKKKGFMGSIMGTIADVGNSIQKGVDSSLGFWDQAAYVRFQHLFPANASETFIGEYAATTISGKRSVDGRIYISSHSLGFVGRLEALKFIIPLNLIGSIQPVFCTVKHEPNHVKLPVFAAANPPNRPNALHIFTKDSRLHQIYSMSQFEYSYGSLDYAWRVVNGGQ